MRTQAARRRKPRRSVTQKTLGRCKNLYQFIRLCLGDAPSDREIARRWKMEWKRFTALKHGQRQMPRIDELEKLAKILGIDSAFVFQVASGTPASAALKLLREIDSQRQTQQVIFDCVPAACILFERDGTMSAANPMVERVCHLTVDELIGKNAIEVFGNPGPAGCPVTRAFLTGRTEQQVSWVENRAKQKTYVHRTAGPVVVGGQVQRVIEILVDVTDQIQRGDLRVLALWRGQPEVVDGDARERRSSPRAEASFHALCRVNGREMPILVQNISSGGLSAQPVAPDMEPPKRGTEVEVSWALPSDGSLVKARGTVVWNRPAAPGKPARFGLYFTTIQPAFAPITTVSPTTNRHESKRSARKTQVASG